MLTFSQLHLIELAVEIPVVDDADILRAQLIRPPLKADLREVNCALRGHISLLMKRQKKNDQLSLTGCIVDIYSADM